MNSVSFPVASSTRTLLPAQPQMSMPSTVAVLEAKAFPPEFAPTPINPEDEVVHHVSAQAFVKTTVDQPPVNDRMATLPRPLRKRRAGQRDSEHPFRVTGL